MLPVAILAGGLATRLRPLTDALPKSMIPIDGMPFVGHQLRLLAHNGIKDVVICAGYHSDVIQDWVGSGRQFGLDVRFSLDGSELLGTGGALKRAAALLGSQFFVLYGDAYVLCDLQTVEDAFYEHDKKALMTIASNLEHRHHSNVFFKDGFIWKYDKKKCLQSMKHFDYGIGVISSDSLDGFVDKFDLEDAYKYLLSCDQLAGLEIQEPVYEVGSFRGIREFEEYCLLHQRTYVDKTCAYL